MTAHNALRKLTFVANLGYPEAVRSTGGIFWLARWFCVAGSQSIFTLTVQGANALTFCLIA